MKGEFSASERLTELGLVSLLQASRTPIRIALERLANEGLLDPISTGGFRVRSFSTVDICDAIEIRGVLEGTHLVAAADTNRQQTDFLFCKWKRFAPLADFVHRLGLKFGIHIIRDIPKQAVRANSPIANSTYRASDAADTSDSCEWNPDNYGVNDSPAGQAWYDSLAQQYADWQVDFIKVDCVADDRFKAGEIRMIREAIRKTGRPIVLSLSPGPAPLERADFVRQYAQMWRISGDQWDH